MTNRILKFKKTWENLPKTQQSLLPDYVCHLDSLDKCVKHNQTIITQIMQEMNHSMMFENKEVIEQDQTGDSVTNNSEEKFAISCSEMDKIRSTLKQFARDWSDYGEQERKVCYQPILTELNQLFPKTSERSKMKILVPGSGMGRLAWEIAQLGFSSQGNEWSMFMLLPTFYILNTCKSKNIFTLYPFVSEFCNVYNKKDQLMSIQVPDVNPSDVPKDVEFSMVAGDFCEVYGSDRNNWDGICTVFFIDTALNIMDYLDVIYNALRPGGYWMNLGPLLYHYADQPDKMSLDISYEDLKQAITLRGFLWKKEEYPVPCTYSQNKETMMKQEYNNVYFVVQKPADC